MIEISNYSIAQHSASFSFSLDETKKNLVVVEDKYIDKFIKDIIGLNKNNSIKYNGRLAFDNINYFDSRIYLDSDIKVFNTLDERYIQKIMLEKFSKAVDDLTLKSYIRKYRLYSLFNNGVSIENRDYFNIVLAFSIFANSFIKLSNNKIIRDEVMLSDIKNYDKYGITCFIKSSEKIDVKTLKASFDNLYVVSVTNFNCYDLTIIKKDFDIINIISNEDKANDEI